jgi:four helix bundle protein
MPKSFHNLVAFQRAVDLMLEVYEVTSSFPKSEMFGLCSQLRRAALGVMSQIAEGDGRITYGEWRQLLSQARGSLFEVEAQILAAHRLKYVADAVRERLNTSIRRTGSALIGLIRWVQSQEQAKKPRYPAATSRPRDHATVNASPQPPR